MLTESTPIIVGTLLGVVFVWLAQRYYRLYSIPGPFLSRLTNLPRVRWVASHKSHEIHKSLHDQYGSVVRFGPNMVSVNDPAAISAIYPTRSGFPKSDFYKVFQSVEDPPDVFSATDEAMHKALRTPVSSLYSYNKLQPGFEEVINQNLHSLFKQFDNVSPEAPCPLTTWLGSFAFETVWAWTFTKPYGLIDMSVDKAHTILESSWEIFKIIGPLSQSASLRGVGAVMNFILTTLKVDTIPPLHKETMNLIKTREDKFALESEKSSGAASQPSDMMSQLQILRKNQPNAPDWIVKSLSLVNVFAGSDSTAVAMGAIWYNLLVHRDTMQQLYEELLAAERQGALTRPIPTWKEVQNLPYLDACMNEALRLHPPFCLPFERIVPASGVTINGFRLPRGTLVGMSPYVVGRHEPTFGGDADQWRPERWIECTAQERRKMESSLIAFGTGRRVCLGKDVATMETKKVISSVLLRYEMEIVDPARFKIENSWFFKQEGLDVKIKRRA